jgi:hypothetical protein
MLSLEIGIVSKILYSGAEHYHLNTTSFPLLLLHIRFVWLSFSQKIDEKSGVLIMEIIFA